MRARTSSWSRSAVAGAGRSSIAAIPLGQCLLSRAKSPGEGVPVKVVDDEIYQKLPSLLIATVDKFAQMPWKGETQMLFGQVNGVCPPHGFRSPEINGTLSHNKRGDLPAVQTQPHALLRPGRAIWPGRRPRGLGRRRPTGRRPAQGYGPWRCKRSTAASGTPTLCFSALPKKPKDSLPAGVADCVYASERMIWLRWRELQTGIPHALPPQPAGRGPWRQKHRNGAA